MAEGVPVGVDRMEYRRRRHHKQRGSKLIWLAALAGLIVAGISIAVFIHAHQNRTRELVGYLADPTQFEQEHAQYLGRPVQDAGIRELFLQAGRQVKSHDYPGAVASLETVSQKAPVPIVFNNLGVLYEQLNDRARAIVSFREALSRDAGYAPVRDMLKMMKNLAPGAADPVTHEVERNDNPGLANLIPLNQPVEAGISGVNDEDYFRFVSPPAPRDMLEIKVENRSQTLAPGLAVYDSDRRFVGWGKDTRDAGASLTQFLSPSPSTTLYLQIWGHKATEGDYTLSVRAMKAYDAYEPNDDIFRASPIQAGNIVDANIMDERDTDFYKFDATRTGTAEVAIENLSDTLIPALSVFTADRRFSGFGPDIRQPGASLKHSFGVEEGRTYYLQVWTQANTAGKYRLKLK